MFHVEQFTPQHEVPASYGRCGCGAERETRGTYCRACRALYMRLYRAKARVRATLSVLILLAAIWLPRGGVAAAAEYYAIDGDTLNVEATGERIRVLGIDAPELHPARCAEERRLGEAAKHALQELVDRGPVTLERLARDRYGRTLARVLIGGHDVAPWMVQHGLARPYRGGPRRPWCLS